MVTVGIDVSKGKSMVTAIKPGGNIIFKPYSVNHTGRELNRLADRILELGPDTKVLMEHTGRYAEPISMFLHEKGIFVSVINPLLIKQFGNNTLRRIKTDKADAVKIARYAIDNWNKLQEYSPMDTIRYQLKTLNRQVELFAKEKTALANNLIALMDQSYPEVNRLFSSPARKDGHQKWVDFIITFWHVDCVRKSSLNAFTERYRNWCSRNGYQFSVDKAKEIHAHSVEQLPLVPKTSETRFMVQTAARQLQSVSATVEAYREQMNRLASQLPEYKVVMSMTGVGESLGPQLMAEIGDVRRFGKAASLVAYAGTDPGANQSGTYESRSNRISKRGSPHLRKTVFVIMTMLMMQQPEFDPTYQFLQKKKSEGKPYYVYMTAGITKFLRIYFGKVRDVLNELDIPIQSTDSDDSI